VKVNVYIEKLVLEGIAVPGGDVRRVREAFQQELSRLLTRSGDTRELQSIGAVPVLRGGTLRLVPGKSSGDLGRNMAGAVYEGIGKRKR
jgi:hypothetical protein